MDEKGLGLRLSMIVCDGILVSMNSHRVYLGCRHHYQHHHHLPHLIYLPILHWGDSLLVSLGFLTTNGLLMTYSVALRTGESFSFLSQKTSCLLLSPSFSEAAQIDPELTEGTIVTIIITSQLIFFSSLSDSCSIYILYWHRKLLPKHECCLLGSLLFVSGVKKIDFEIRRHFESVFQLRDVEAI